MNKNSWFFILSIFLLNMFLTGCDNEPQVVEVTRLIPTIIEPEPQPIFSTEITTKILERVQQRGYVICGSRDDLLGYGYLDDMGNHVGFDIDLCRAVAAAVLGDSEAIEVVDLEADERGPALISFEVDMLARTSTWTSSRDAEWGNFTITMFYDGQGFMVRKDSGISTLDDLQGTTICVSIGTTTEQNLTNAFRQRGWAFKPEIFDSVKNAYSAYDRGVCDAVTTDKAGLSAARLELANPNDHIILEATISKEPLTPVVPAHDDQWFDLVKTVMYVLINAEELDVNSSNVLEMLNNDNIEVRRLLGVEQSFGQSQLGLNQDFAVDVIRLVGNYGEIYDRHFGEDGIVPLPRGLNELWSKGGIIYAPPLK